MPELESRTGTFVSQPPAHFSHQHIDSIVKQHFPKHPFQNLSGDLLSLKATMSEYLAMSIAFPYLQAGSCAAPVIKAITQNQPIPVEVQMTSVVGAFLVWDEFGGWFKTSMRGARGLPSILDTSAFHANILQSDLLLMFGEEIKPIFGPSTQTYLLSLYEKLSAPDDLIRCATMTSFETHAERMITELWESLYKAIGIEKNKLRYFMGHVGGDDPAEAYHVQMTQRLIDTLAHNNEREFEQAFIDCYGLHVKWCESIIKHTTLN